MNKFYFNSIKNTVLSSKPSTAIRLLLMVLFVSITPMVSFGQSQTFSTPGTYTFNVPAGVTTLNVQAWGSGGGAHNTYDKAGGGGAFAGSNSLTVISGGNYTIKVGTGAVAGTGGDGEDSSFGSIVIAKGGKGGANSGIGGLATASTGTIKFNGGNGGSSTGNGGAGGGGAGGTSTIGSAGGNTTTNSSGPGGSGGTTGGGNGGNGGSRYNDGIDGSFPGGGGGERGEDGTSSGGGGNGQVIVSWTCPTYSLTGLNTTTSTCISAGTSTVTLKGTAGSLPVGSYTVTYNTDIPYQSGKTATMTVSTAGTGTFTATGLTIYSGASVTSTVTVTNIASGTCSNAISSNNTAGVTVYANSIGGNVDYATTPICINTATTLNLSGSTGSVVQWEKRVNGGSWTIITNTTTTLTETPSSSGTWEYRALVGNGSCSSVYSASRSVVVNPLVTITLSSTNTTICQTTTTANLSYTATTGSPVHWYIDFDSTANTAISDQDNNLSGTSGNITIQVPSSMAAGVYNGNLTVVTYTPSCSSIIYPITLTVNPNGVAGVSIAASPSGAICSGTSVTFTATPTNGGTTPIYQWKLNGTNVGTNSATYTNTALANGNAVTCVMTSSSTCVTGSPATSGTITMSVNPSVAASVAIAASPSGAICSGTSVTFTATPTNGGTIPIYQWYNGVTAISGATSATYTTTTLANNDVIKVIMTSNASPCVSGSPATSNSLTATIIASPVISGTVTPATCSNGSDGAITVTGLNVPIEFKKADNDYIDLGSPILSGKSAFTVEGWVKFNLADVGSRMSLFGQNDIIEFYLNTNTIELWTPNTGVITTPITAAIGNNAWHHIAATGNGTSTNIYIDGVLKVTGPGTANYGTSAYNSQIGSGVVDPLTPAGGGFTGQIGKVGFYSTALAAGTISTLATSPTTYLGTETGLIAGYNFFEGSGTVLSKLPAGTNGTFGNSPQWSYTYAWTKTGTPSYSASTKNISGLSPGDYNLSISTLGGGCPITKTFTVGYTNTTPSMPTVGTTTQPNCTTATGSVGLSGLPAGNWTINPGSVSGNTASTTISGLAAGTYNFTVTNSTGCTSSATGNVVINPVVTNTWNGGWDNGTPPTINGTQNLVFNAGFTTTADLSGCSCTVNTGAVKIQTGNNLILEGKLTVIAPGTLTFENNASLVQTTFTGANTGNITYNRASTTIREFDYTYWSSPVAGQNLLAVSPSTQLDKFLFFDATANGWVQVGDPSTTSMTVGKGYIIRGIHLPSSPPPAFPIASFYGVPNNGNITIPVVGGQTSNLIGNPYPSAIYADQFLFDNQSKIDGTLYFWTHNTPIAVGTPDPGTGAWAYSGNDYASYSLTGGVGTGKGTYAISGGVKPTGKIAAGQSFFTTSTTVGGPVTFTNTMRVDGLGIPLNNSNFYKTKNSKTTTASTIEKHRVWLNLTNTQGAFKQTLVGYITGATNTWDKLYDGESFDGNNFLDFYSINEDKNLTIQGRALPFDVNDEIPLGYRIAVEGNFTIDIDETDGLLANQEVFLEDKLTNKTVNLKEGKYTFSTAAGTFDDRFVLKYSSKTLGVDPIDLEDGISVFYSNNNKTLIIRNKVMDSTVNSASLFNMAGQKIAVWDVKDSEQTNIQIPIKDISSEIYIVKVKTTKGEISKKIIVN